MLAGGHHKADTRRAIRPRDSRAATGSSLRQAAIRRKQVDTALKVSTARRPDTRRRGIHRVRLADTRRPGQDSAAPHQVVHQPRRARP
jgi:hypothetical protein